MTSQPFWFKIRSAAQMGEVQFYSRGCFIWNGQRVPIHSLDGQFDHWFPERPSITHRFSQATLSAYRAELERVEFNEMVDLQDEFNDDWEPYILHGTHRICFVTKNIWQCCALAEEWVRQHPGCNRQCSFYCSFYYYCSIFYYYCCQQCY